MTSIRTADQALEVSIGSRRLSIDDVVYIARELGQVMALSAEDEARIQENAQWVIDMVEEIESARENGEKTQPFYGINTGFGGQAGKSALDSKYLTKVLSRNLVASHSIGVGDYLEEEIVRATMLIRAHSLAQGHSGARPLIIQKLVDMLNKRVYPAIPEKGSLGSSGDLAPLSHLALAMSKVPLPGPADKAFDLDPTDGEIFVPIDPSDFGVDGSDVTYHISRHHITREQKLWRRVGGREGMAKVGGQIELQAKEGLALNNGATFSAGIAALCSYDARNLLANAELALAMTLEGIRGFRDSFFPEIHEARGHAGAIRTAANVLRYVDGSQLLDRADRDKEPLRTPPQDPYSVRCGAQVLGTVRDTLAFASNMMTAEINAITDNPLIFLDLPRKYKTVSGGNFHGEPIAMAMDFLGIAITELGSISERRTFKLTDFDPDTDEEGRLIYAHGLYDNLIKEEKSMVGLNSGFMIAQYTAASLVSDCKTLAHPDSVDSITSSANREDHVSMSMNAARHAREIIKNIENVIAIEFLCAAHAIDLQLAKKRSKGLCAGRGTLAAHSLIREFVDELRWDRALYPDLRKAVRLVRSGELVKAARKAIE